MSNTEQISIDMGEEILEEQPLEQVEAPPEAPPEAQKEEEKVTFSPEQQEIMNREIGKKTAKLREVERQAEEERQRIEQLQQKVAEYEAPVRPDIPPPPDPYDDDYEASQKARDAAIAQAAAFDARMEAVQAQNQKAMQDYQEAQSKKIIESVQTYAGRADKLGIKPDELQIAGNKVAAFGIQDDLAQHILNDEMGPNITMYLSDNVQELEAINGMTPLQAAAYIETNVKPKATREPVAPPPEPPELVAGKGFQAERGPPGVQYE